MIIMSKLEIHQICKIGLPQEEELMVLQIQLQLLHHQVHFKKKSHNTQYEL